MGIFELTFSQENGAKAEDLIYKGTNSRRTNHQNFRRREQRLLILFRFFLEDL